MAVAATGKMAYYIKGSASELVGIEDAATALILAAEKGRNGERRFGIPLKAMYVLGFGGDRAARVLRRDMPLSVSSVD